jgi:hypothetical protein
MLMAKKRVKAVLLSPMVSTGSHDPIVMVKSAGYRLFHLNLTISDNGNGKEYKESFISMRMAELVLMLPKDTNDDINDLMDMFRMSFTSHEWLHRE